LRSTLLIERGHNFGESLVGRGNKSGLPAPFSGFVRRPQVGKLGEQIAMGPTFIPSHLSICEVESH
jgi:hypothetical protein